MSLAQSTFEVLTGRELKEPSDGGSVDGFYAFFNSLGIRYFSAAEAITPHSLTLAHALGYTHLLPPASHWARGAALFAMADNVRHVVGVPVAMRNWYRPNDYNARVGGSAESDHLTSHAVDLDFASRRDRAIAEAYVMQWYRVDFANMSLGVGGASIHLGLWSPKGKRDWRYASYSAEGSIGLKA